MVAIDRDLQRVNHARKVGADLALGSTERDTPSRVREFARYGADVAIITTASPSAEPIELAASISRDRGRIVVVGTVDLGSRARRSTAKNFRWSCLVPTDRAATIPSTKKMVWTIQWATCAGQESGTWRLF